MKKIILLLILTLAFESCGTYVAATEMANDPNMRMGMTYQEFLKLPMGKHATLVKVEGAERIYEIRDHDVWTGLVDGQKFFYFINGKLTRMDGGVSKQKRYEFDINN
tara:strand:- start:490 stop:810 length:321 start_codon:yes stop_codon:yes gene_type:complete